VTRKPDHRGEHEGNRKTIAQGMPECSGEPVDDFVLSLHETMGASGTRHSLRPLTFLGCMKLQNSGAVCRENAGACLTVIANDPARISEAASGALLNIPRGIQGV
jgi:hypothetical protein